MPLPHAEENPATVFKQNRFVVECLMFVSSFKRVTSRRFIIVVYHVKIEAK